MLPVACTSCSNGDTSDTPRSWSIAQNTHPRPATRSLTGSRAVRSTIPRSIRLTRWPYYTGSTFSRTVGLGTMEDRVVSAEGAPRMLGPNSQRHAELTRRKPMVKTRMSRVISEAGATRRKKSSIVVTAPAKPTTRTTSDAHLFKSFPDPNLAHEPVQSTGWPSKRHHIDRCSCHTDGKLASKSSETPLPHSETDTDQGNA
jgi:hypothetical protein